MNIAPWMKHPVVTVKPRDSAVHARALMAKHRINQVPVVVGSRLVGIVTDRDLRDAFPSVFEAAASCGGSTDPAAIPVEHLMTAKVVSLPPDASLADAARIMRRERIGAVPIVEAGRLVGLLARSDVLDAFVELSRNGKTAA
jgi:acetoin utilization protein AcuB